MHFQAALLFVKEIGKFFALIAWKLLNSISQRRHNKKSLKISAVDLGKILFLCTSNKKVKSRKSRDTAPLNVDFSGVAAGRAKKTWLKIVHAQML
jgi:hypothetical protein